MRPASLLASMATLLSVCGLTQAQGQKTYIGYAYPTGGAQGDSVVITLGGQKISDAKRVIVSGGGVTAEILPPLVDPNQKGKKKKKRGKKKIITDEDNMQIADRLRVRLSIDGDAQIGLRDLKVVGARGVVSNRLFFEVGQFPNTVEREPNGSLAEATPVPRIPTVLNGQVERGGRDWFRFTAKKGQHIVAAVKAQQLVPFLADAVPGWFQPVLALYDAQGREVGFSDDYQLRPDPTIVYKVPADGEYYLEIKDCIYRGREDFVYRIALGEIPHVSSVFPLGGQAGKYVKLQLMGVNLKNKTRQISVSKKLGRKSVPLKGDDGFVTNEVQLEVSDDKEIVAYKDAGETKKQAVKLKMGEVYNERIMHDYDQDWFKVELKRGKKLKFDVLSRRLGSPLDADLRLYNEAGKQLAASDDVEDDREGLMTHHADAQLDFTVPQDGTYYLRLTDAQNKYGADYGYRLRYYDSEEDFALSMSPSAISIPSGGTAHFTVFPVRMNGFRRPITLSALNLPRGYTLSEGVLRGQMKAMKMSITAPAGAKTGPLNFKIKGTASLRSGEKLERVAAPAEEMMQAFFITHLLPIDEFRVDVTEPAPFRLEVVNTGKPIQLKGKTQGVPLRLRIIRDAGFDKTVQFTVKGPKWIKGSYVTAGPDDKEVDIMLTCDRWRRPNVPVSIHVVAMVEAKTIKGRVGGKRNQVATSASVITPFIKLLTPSTPDPSPQQRKKNKKNNTN